MDICKPFASLWQAHSSLLHGPQNESSQACWEGHVIQILVEMKSECQSLQACWKDIAFEHIWVSTEDELDNVKSSCAIALAKLSANTPVPCAMAQISPSTSWLCSSFISARTPHRVNAIAMCVQSPCQHQHSHNNSQLPCSETRTCGTTHGKLRREHGQNIKATCSAAQKHLEKMWICPSNSDPSECQESSVN